MPDKLRLSQIRIDGGTQPRASINADTVNDYAEAMTEGATFPPVVVFYDGSTYWLADGFHRYTAAKQNGFLDIEVEIHQGTRRQAVLYSVGANAAHGMRRTNADKRRAVETLLRDEKWGTWSDEKIAQHCAVTREYVNRMRRVTCDQVTSERTYTTKHGTEATMRVEKIGKREEQGDSVTPVTPSPSPAPTLKPAIPDRTVEVEREPVHVPQPIAGDDPSSVRFTQWMNRISGRAFEISLSGVPIKEAFALALGESYREGHFTLP